MGAEVNCFFDLRKAALASGDQMSRILVEVR